MKKILAPLLIFSLFFTGCGTVSTTPKTKVNVVKKTNVNIISPPRILEINSAGQDVLTLNQELAYLNYLPLKADQNGNLVWEYSNIPSQLKSLWNSNKYTLMTEGAVMSFQHQNNLSVDGVAGPQLFKALNSALKNHQNNRYGYCYVYVSQKIPETLKIWYNGKIVLTSLTNTGIKGAATPNGTWPVYDRYLSQEMKGTNPDGTKYDDPNVQYVSYYYQGCAVHGFSRANYGFPQSVGCDELPISAAKIAWNYMNYGTLVTVSEN